jgi:hypothetical protein
MFRAMSGASVVDCGFVMGGRKLSGLGIKFSVECCSDTILNIDWCTDCFGFCLQEEYCIAHGK